MQRYFSMAKGFSLELVMLSYNSYYLGEHPEVTRALLTPFLIRNQKHPLLLFISPQVQSSLHFLNYRVQVSTYYLIYDCGDSHTQWIRLEKQLLPCSHITSLAVLLVEIHLQKFLLNSQLLQCQINRFLLLGTALMEQLDHPHSQNFID